MIQHLHICIFDTIVHQLEEQLDGDLLIHQEEKLDLSSDLDVFIRHVLFQQLLKWQFLQLSQCFQRKTSSQHNYNHVNQQLDLLLV